jgi:hypothetical protein
MSSPPNYPIRLKEALPRAEMLISFLAESERKIVPSKLTLDVSRIRNKVDRGEPLTPEDETTFWSAMSSIALQADPATVAGLEHLETQAREKKWINYLSIKAQVVFALILFVFIQAYVGIGVTMTTKFEARYAQIWSANLQDDSPANQKLRTEIQSLDQQLQAWNKVWRCPVQLRCFSSTDSISEVSAGETAKNVVFLAQGYVLPLLLGWLGAGVNALRQINEDEKLRRLSRVMIPGYRVRMLLGAIGGATIGLLISSGAEANGGLMVSPLAFAFLAGYNVEILFAMLDRLIRHVKDNFENARTPGASLEPPPESNPPARGGAGPAAADASNSPTGRTYANEG